MCEQQFFREEGLLRRLRNEVTGGDALSALHPEAYALAVTPEEKATVDEKRRPQAKPGTGPTQGWRCNPS